MHLYPWIGIALVALPLPVLAEVPAPTSAEAKKVIEYYYSGKEQGPVLADFKLCSRVDGGKDSPTRHQCMEPVAGPVKQGTTVQAWTLWLVPDGAQYDDVVIQTSLEGQVRTTVDLKLATSLRSRTYRPVNLTKAGKWQVRVLRGTAELAAANVVVE